MVDKLHLLNRFLSYVKIDTQSDPSSDNTPSTKKQWKLANKIAEELKNIGLSQVSIDENAYVFGTLPSNVKHNVPTIGFISHFDTSPDFTAINVNPKIIQNYDGKDIILNAKENIILSPNYFEELSLYKGQTIITTDGKTLLGADDKAGVCEIISAMEYLKKHPEIKHGTIKVGFTPDEEIGRGAKKFDITKFGAEWAYTMDGSQIGELEYENFNAANVKITIYGKIVHPGYAKGKMINSMYYAQKLIEKLPKKEVPELTQDYQGFFHLQSIEGNVEKTILNYLIRDHDLNLFNNRKLIIKEIVNKLSKEFNKVRFEIDIQDQYFNMKEKIVPVIHIVEIAETAMKELKIKPIIKPIRGGTDGSQLSYKGLPCPNIFAGGHNFHGPYEYIPLQSMVMATNVICKIAELTQVRYR